jgi:hypothetical protein
MERRDQHTDMTNLPVGREPRGREPPAHRAVGDAGREEAEALVFSHPGRARLR